MLLLAESATPSVISPILELCSKYEWYHVLIIWLLVNTPSIAAWFSQKGHTKAMKEVYTRYLADKDKEIERQAVRIKDLENYTLKTKRK